MIRKQVYIEPLQDALLKARAKALGVTEAELIRRCIDHMPDSDAEARRRAALQELQLMWDERAATKVPQTGRTWARDDIYDGRVGRISR
jgi:hypothetical protein